MRNRAFVPLATVFALAGCPASPGSDDGGTDESDSDSGDADYEVELNARNCSFTTPGDIGADCYTLRVPADRLAPEEGSVELPIVVLYAGGEPSRPPVVYLHGGPGGQAVAFAPNWLDEPLLRDGPLILLDQRGSGGALPSLDCPEVADAWLDNFEVNDTAEAELDRMRRAVLECRARLAETVDLDDYHSEASADDLEDLRRAFGIDAWILYGVSYGTRLAMVTARRHPEGVHSIVLDSAYPPEFGDVEWMETSARDSTPRVLAGCLEEPQCSATFPEVEGQLEVAIAALNAEPFALTVEVPEQGTRELTLHGADFYAGLYNAAYDAELIPLMPFLVFSAAGGNYGFLEQFVDLAFPQLWSMSEGARLSIDCSDTGRLIDGEALTRSIADNPRFATIYAGYAVPFCEEWDVEPRPAPFNEPVTSPVPTLIFAGEFDPVTPVGQSEAAAASLPNAELFVFPGEGHGLSLSNPCAGQMLREFLRDPDSLDRSCFEELSSLTF